MSAMYTALVENETKESLAEMVLDLRAALAWPVMPEEPSEAVLSKTRGLYRGGELLTRGYYRAIREALLDEQGGRVVK